MNAELFDQSANDFSRVKPSQIFEIRKAFALALMQEDIEFMKMAKEVIKWANANEWLFQESTSIAQD